ncbi:hypothetical protein OGAPHI_002231 [Ogataea philodendri]|uniref:Uncharacterized protein n=1 Tax=Ogataea philodendri TaxID=1378263 RepID=A0A9P8PAL9_9ASCO|nr:uncharacterized protein OGAPHI_002231 [Ogataea philodendri]KAH3668477.1 hypothetical protein OGAPHI_002231 [Ogataea philodendri]
MMFPRRSFPDDETCLSSPSSYLRYQPVEYDPSIDPTNMEQYQPKVYKVESEYRKIDAEEETNEKTALEVEKQPEYPPAYSDVYALNDTKESQHDTVAPAPKYGSFQRVLRLMVVLFLLITLLDSVLRVAFDCEAEMSNDAMVNKGNIALVRYQDEQMQEIYIEILPIEIAFESESLTVDQINDTPKLLQ